MIIVDTALQQRAEANQPIRVAMTGAGNIGRAITLQIERYVAGMTLAAIANRTIENAAAAYRIAGIDQARRVETAAQLEETLAAGTASVTDDPAVICAAEGVDVIIEATGEVEYGARVAMAAIAHRKHIVLMNAELDATLGPILKVHADRAGVIVTNADGDQPGVMMNLLRFVRGIGYLPVLAGNIKGLLDHYRTPDTQKGFAEKYGLTPKMATSFADGTKISMENAVVANATGFKVGQRGMYGPQCRHVTEAADLFPRDRLLDGGLVDYILGAEPGPGVFVIGYDDHPVRRHYMQHLKMGDGPLHVFYVPYHLPHLEVSNTVARVALFRDAAVAPLAGPVCEVITLAKRDLSAGETLDGIGGFCTYGTIENHDVGRSQGLLPMGLSEGCVLKRPIAKDRAVAYDDVVMPATRLCDTLRQKQDAYFK